MKKLVQSASLAFTILVFSTLCSAQKLPQGQYHANRERNYDIVHYKAEISFNFAERKVIGRSTIKLAPLHPLDSISLDAIHLNVHRVTDEAGQTAYEYRTTTHSLVIRLPDVKGPYDPFTIVVDYDCQPKAGLYFRRNMKAPTLFYVTTYGEGGLHANWLPTYNDVNDKFPTEVLVTVPPPYVAISNGKLVETLSRPDGQRTYHWVQKLPHSDYLMALYIGDFEKGALDPAFGAIPIGFWVPRGRLKEGAYAFRNTTRMVEFFSQRLNYLFPWDKYDQVAVPDYAIGAMEHTGVTGHQASVLRGKTAPLDFSPTFDDYTTDWTAESTISHELAHHWFGDNLTCRNLSTIWLNESFASYMMMLWDEEAHGKDQLLFDVQLAKKHYFDYVKTAHIIRPLEYHHFDDPNTIYNTQHTYLKGAAVLHMLRRVLGDGLFFRALSYYLHKNEFSNVESQDFKLAIEASTGRNLEWFFNQWVTGAGHPQFEVTSHYLADRKLIDLSVKQVQSIVEGQGIFTLPVKVTIATPTRSWQEKIWIKADRHHFLFSCDEAPLMVSFDGEGDLVAELTFPKSIEELIYQATHDAVPGKLWAIRELASRFPVDRRTVKTFAQLITRDSFWGVQAEAAKQLGTLRTPAAEELVARALESKDYRVRKAAVLALAGFGTASAEQTLKRVITADPHSDVVGTAIVTLAKADASIDPAIIRQQLSRQSWQHEITIACLNAFRALKDAALAAEIKPYTGEEYNQDVRQAALLAWEACAPTDGELRRALIPLTQSPVYTLQQLAIKMLGRLHASQASEALNTIVAQDADANLIVAAKNALREIERVDKPSN